jgi:hypothetical protein
MGILAAQPVLAQSWGGDRDDGYGGYNSGNSYNSYNSYGNGDWRTNAICSGERARNLEQKLNREEQEGEIDSDDASSVHSQIDQLEDRQRNDCENGDWRDVRVIANQYDRLDRWIDNEAHGSGYYNRSW